MTGLPTIDAAILFEELTERGVSLYATDGGRLRYRPASLMSSEDLKRLRTYKSELLQLLADSPNLSSPSSPSSPPPTKADTYGKPSGDDTAKSIVPSTVPDFVRAEEERRKHEAQALGLVARWSREFGYVSLHDPTTGEWHDVATEDAPAWARNEAFLRKRIYRERGVSRLLNTREIAIEWRQSVPDMPDSFVGAKAGRRAGLVYDDDLDLGEDAE